jgi:tetratricopeptide (TPR) repeat protein
MNMPNQFVVRFCAMPIALCLVMGCGSKESIEVNRVSQVSYDEALKLVESGSYAQALPLLDQSITAGGLSADLYASALLLRSRCYSDANELEKAQADLDHAEQGSPSPAEYQLAKGCLLAKQGKKSEADAAFKAAKKLDSTITLPK